MTFPRCRPDDTKSRQRNPVSVLPKSKVSADLQLIKMNAYNSQYCAGQYAFDRTYTQGPDPNQSSLDGGNGLATMLRERNIQLGVRITF
jgi:hypothetical protein